MIQAAVALGLLYAAAEAAWAHQWAIGLADLLFASVSARLAWTKVLRGRQAARTGERPSPRP